MIRFTVSLATLTAAVPLLLARDASAQATELFVASYAHGTISVSNPDGGGSATVLVSGLGEVDGVAIDPTGGNLYWASVSTGLLQRATLSGTGVVTVLSGLAAPRAIALNVEAGTMYWTELGSGLVREANIDGTSPRTLATEAYPAGLALDLVGGHLFWSGETAGQIVSAGLDGGSPQVIISQPQVLGLAVDPSAAKLYFAECAEGTIRRANFDGSNIEVLVTGLAACPTRIAIDPVAGMFYFSDNGSSVVLREAISLSGGAQPVAHEDLPTGIALLIPTPSACVSPPSGLLGWWTLDETSGIVAHDQLSRSNGQYFGGATHVPGEVFGAVGIGSTAQYVDVPNANIQVGTSFSIDAWVQVFDNDTSVRTIVDNRGGSVSNPVGYNLYISYGKLGLQLGDGTTFTNYEGSDPLLVAGSWHLVAGTVDYSTKPPSGQLYVDGTLYYTFTPTQNDSFVNTSDFLLGKSAFDDSINFDGDIDEVELFGRALMPSEVYTLYQAGSYGKCRLLASAAVPAFGGAGAGLLAGGLLGFGVLWLARRRRVTAAESS